MARQDAPVTGGCLCGAVRYESTQPPTMGAHCHCSRCRKAYGGLFSTALRFPVSTFRFMNGEPKYYRSSNVGKLGFCSECGSPLVFVYDANPNLWVKLGSLDHPNDWPMTKDASWGHATHWHTDTKISWYEISDGLPQQVNPEEELAARERAAKAPTPSSRAAR